MAGILPIRRKITNQSIYQLLNKTVYEYLYLWFQIYAKSPNKTSTKYSTQRFQTNLCRKFIQRKHIK